MESYSPIHTIVVTGHKETGKSTLIQQLTKNRLTIHDGAYNTIEKYKYRYHIGLREVLFHIYETSGNHCHTPSVFKKCIDNSDGIIIVHDVNEQMNKSLECTRTIVREILNNETCNDTEIFLACNKIDLVQGQKIAKEEKRLARKYGITMFQISATEKRNVHEMFESLFSKIWYRNLLQDPSYTAKNFNILLVGDKGVGKTSLAQQFSKNRFSENRIEHDEIFHTVCHTIVNEQLILLTVREGPDTDDFRAVISKYYEDIHGVIVVYDMCSRSSFTNVQKWITIVNRMRNAPFIPKLLVGNKSDCLPDVEVAFEEANILASEKGFKLYQTSAKNNSMVFEVFNKLSQYILYQHNKNDLPQQKGCFDCFFHTKNRKFSFPTSLQLSPFSTPRMSPKYLMRTLSLPFEENIKEELSDEYIDDSETIETVLSRTASEELKSLLQMFL